MSFFDLMKKSGVHVHIIPGTPETANYSPAEFWIDAGRVYGNFPGIGSYNMHRPDIKKADFDAHVLNMIDDGFSVKLSPA